MDRCPNCGASVRANARFCTACGHRLSPAEPTPTPEAVPTTGPAIATPVVAEPGPDPVSDVPMTDSSDWEGEPAHAADGSGDAAATTRDGDQANDDVGPVGIDDVTEDRNSNRADWDDEPVDLDPAVSSSTIDDESIETVQVSEATGEFEESSDSHGGPGSSDNVAETTERDDDWMAAEGRDRSVDTGSSDRSNGEDLVIPLGAPPDDPASDSDPWSTAIPDEPSVDSDPDTTDKPPSITWFDRSSRDRTSTESDFEEDSLAMTTDTVDDQAWNDPVPEAVDQDYTDPSSDAPTEVVTTSESDGGSPDGHPLAGAGDDPASNPGQSSDDWEPWGSSTPDDPSPPDEATSWSATSRTNAGLGAVTSAPVEVTDVEQDGSGSTDPIESAPYAEPSRPSGTAEGETDLLGMVDDLRVAISAALDRSQESSESSDRAGLDEIAQLLDGEAQAIPAEVLTGLEQAIADLDANEYDYRPLQALGSHRGLILDLLTAYQRRGDLIEQLRSIASSNRTP